MVRVSFYRCFKFVQGAENFLNSKPAYILLFVLSTKQWTLFIRGFRECKQCLLLHHMHPSLTKNYISRDACDITRNYRKRLGANSNDWKTGNFNFNSKTRKEKTEKSQRKAVLSDASNFQKRETTKRAGFCQEKVGKCYSASFLSAKMILAFLTPKIKITFLYSKMEVIWHVLVKFKRLKNTHFSMVKIYVVSWYESLIISHNWSFLTKNMNKCMAYHRLDCKQFSY